MPHTRLRLAAGCSALTLALGLGAAGLAGATGDPRPARGTAPERPVIVEVTGDAANGFGITYVGGGTLSPPTDSEARAECSEYDTGIARVRCRVEVRTWYRDLGDLQRSLAHLAEQGAD
jgi:hypothetical protein